MTKHRPHDSGVDVFATLACQRSITMLPAVVVAGGAGRDDVLRQWGT